MSSRRPPAAPRTSSAYTQVRTEDEDDLIPIVRQTRSNSPLPWVAVVVLSLLLAGNAWQQGGLFNAHKPNAMGSYEKGFRTELGTSCKRLRLDRDQTGEVLTAVTVQTYIRLEEKKFHGAFRVDDQGYWRLSTNPDEPQYVGPPHMELDNNWIRMVTRKHFPPFTLTPQ